MPTQQNLWICTSNFPFAWQTTGGYRFIRANIYEKKLINELVGFPANSDFSHKNKKKKLRNLDFFIPIKQEFRFSKIWQSMKFNTS